MSDEEPAPKTNFDIFHHRHVKQLRDQLLESALTYILTGRDGTEKDRLRTASDLAGIPIAQLEVELEKKR